MSEPIRIMPETGEIIAVIRRHQDFTDVFRTMKERLGLSNEFIDSCGLTKGHADKIFGPSESKSWGPTTFDLFCELFTLEFHAKIDLDAVKRMEGVWEQRKRAPTENSRISRKLIEKAKPFVLSARGKQMNSQRNCKLSGELRSKIARKAGKSRMKKVTKSERSAMALKGWETRRRKLTSPASPCAIAAQSV